MSQENEKHSDCYFWAKTTSAGLPGISVFQHMLNVGEVAKDMFLIIPSSLRPHGFSPENVAAIAALHDVGKISSGFQRKCPQWLESQRLTQMDRNNAWNSHESNHGLITQKHLHDYLKALGVQDKAARAVAAAVGSHHGKICFRPLRVPPKLSDENKSGIRWEMERNDVCKRVFTYFSACPKEIKTSLEDPFIWWLAGLTSVADWIGSDERFFSAAPFEDKQKREQIAAQALASIGLNPPEVKPGISFEKIFGFFPNDLQIKTHAHAKGKGVYVIEAPMGIGKTEAALWAAYRLLENRQATGIFFALPTQATSNRIHKRLDAFVRVIAKNAQKTRLIHANSWLLEDVPDTKNEGRDWFASSKRALLSSFGVGTIDQALLGIVAAKHFFVRRFALAGKIVILDEIHSYDAYTGSLVEKLVGLLLDLNCTVIILSATLTASRRQPLLQDKTTFQPQEAADPFPLISVKKHRDEQITCLTASGARSRNVCLLFKTHQEAQNMALAAARQGACVLWITDTIDSAQDTFEGLSLKAAGQYKIGLLHARFPLWRREQIEEEWITRLNKNGTTREASILVSTQIVEQSLDIDADLIVSELAPMDMLLQRMGRLWRHERSFRALEHASFVLLEEKEDFTTFCARSAEQIKNILGSKSYVYEPYVLLRTLEKLLPYRNGRQLVLPDEIRNLIEGVYAPPKNDEPTGWQNLEREMQGRMNDLRQFAASNTNILSPSLPDEEGVQTRLVTRKMLSIILCSEDLGQTVTFLDGQQIKFEHGAWDLGSARIIHRNLVKIPIGNLKACPDPRFENYLSGNYCLGIVKEGRILVRAQMATLRWSHDLGVRILKDREKEE